MPSVRITYWGPQQRPLSPAATPYRIEWVTPARWTTEQAAAVFKQRHPGVLIVDCDLAP